LERQPERSQLNRERAAGEILLDLREGASLEPGLLRQLDEIMASNFVVFNDMIATLSRGHERDIDWWVSRPATRNVHAGALFAQCMQLALVRTLLQAGRCLTVLVNSPEMIAVLRRSPHPEMTVLLSGGTGPRRIARTFTDIAASVFHCAAAALAARATRRTTPTPTLPLTVVNTFVSRDGVKGGEFVDRYYPGLRDAVPEPAKSALYYLPIFYRVRHYLKTFRALRNGQANFLFYEDHVGLSDYAFAFGHWWRARRLMGKKASFAGFEIGALVDADIAAGRFASTVVRALLAYRFHRAAGYRNFSIRHVLDWYEGLDLNHAIAAGIQWHGALTQLVGFRSASSLYYISCNPAPHEIAADVTPRTLAVVGSGMAREVGNLAPAVRVIPAPGLRYRPLRTLTRGKPPEGGSVLVALPLFRRSAGEIILTLARARAMMANPPLHWWIKPHPMLPRAEILEEIGGQLPEGMSFIDGDFYHWLVQADLVVGAASSTLMESVALGVPSLCMAQGNKPTEIPVPSWVDPTLSRVVYGAEDALRAIVEMSNRGISVDRAALHDAMLGDASPEAVRTVLGLEPMPPRIREIW
jgi:hypothetical protein